jgi:hypothetical protein
MMRRREILKSAALLATGGLAYTRMGAAEAEPDAETLLRNVVQRYSAMRSYADTGTVSQVINSNSDDAPYRIDFTTAYQSPSLFRFAFSRPHSYPSLSYIVTNYVVGFDGSVAYLATKGPDKPAELELANTLNMALAQATGISSGSAHTIGRLLLRDVSGLSFLDLVGARLMADAAVGGHQCYAISAQHPRGGEWQLWIEKDTLLLRKLRMSLGTQTGLDSEEIHDNIRVNQPIDASVFRSDT